MLAVAEERKAQVLEATDQLFSFTVVRRNGEFVNPLAIFQTVELLGATKCLSQVHVLVRTQNILHSLHILRLDREYEGTDLPFGHWLLQLTGTERFGGEHWEPDSSIPAAFFIARHKTQLL